ncbi:GGDEF domain-containing protein [Vibrio sp. MACH09]|uniref:GGDEF domain-containing protein n=1 Tax=unclassified Vibrio TaxID=2614977 RepID=UPI0014933B9B|nr:MULTISPECIES: GGDEF domain-containing protein [unclassified Vibrio]NOI68076.1 GGDEF domain-containing protein [Vibrio sp. 99-8-1]GLO60850.1 GGDEF domain-containing protein [Vibrio sp. MACH09]
MKSFQWDKSFETGIDEVDEQHLYLVELLNKYGELTNENDFSLEDAKQVLVELSAYTSYHFYQEEMLMKRAGISQQHFQEHHATHQKFIRDLNEFAEAVSDNRDNLSQSLWDFLAQWLVYHILGSDQNMARQIAAIEQGVDSDYAYEMGEREHDEAVGPLLKSLKAMFEQVSERNKQLVLLNQSLEEKVRQRTEQLSLANEKLQRQSFTDVLTQLPNRRFAMQELSQQWDFAQENDSDLVCMIIDADKFKQVNDNCGHDAGDSVLIKLAKELQSGFRQVDTVCRLGGDEFIVVCPNIDLNNGMKLAQKVHRQIQLIRMEYDQYCWHGSISVGVSCRTAQMKDLSELIKLADESVYKAKDCGKNCVRSVQLA